MNKILRVAMVVVVVAALVFGLAACSEAKTGNRIVGGKDVQTFTYAYVYVGSEKITEGYVMQWRDYDECDEVQVLIDGKYYLTHYSNVVLVADPSHGTLGYSDTDSLGID